MKFEFLVLLLNAGFWIWFWRAVFHLHVYAPQLDAAEFVAFNHGESFLHHDFLNVPGRLHLPSFIVVRMVGYFVPFHVANSVLGFNSVGLRFLWITLLSPLQWYWIARGLERSWLRIGRTNRKEM